METTNYLAPVDTLLTYGPIKLIRAEEWPEYLALGFGPEHIPDLIRMAKDENLRYKYFDTGAYPDFNENEDGHPEYWAPIHAIHVLGALHATSASEQLLPLFDEAMKFNDDWVAEDLPMAYRMFGPEAAPPLVTYITESDHDMYALAYAIETLQNIAIKHPDTRKEAIAVFAKQLENFEKQSDVINANLVASLVQLKVVEAAPLIERVFAANKIDIAFIGDWDDVQVLLGLQTTQQRDDKRRKDEFGSDGVSTHSTSIKFLSNKQATKKKAKAKLAKMARKKNKPKK